MRPTALPGWPRPTRPATARRCARAHTGAVTVVGVEQGEVLEHPRQRGHPPSKQVEAAAQRSFLPTGRVEKLGRRRRSLTRWGLWWLAGSCVRVGRERKLRRKCTRRKRRQGGCSGLRSPWRGSRRWRRPGNGGGTLGQRHSTRTVTWSASDMGDGAVGTGGREARRGRRRQRGGGVGHGPVRTAFNPHAHFRTSPPTTANQGAAQGDTATDHWAHTSVFFRIKNYSRTKIAQNK
jgi:hypothetical protein